MSRDWIGIADDLNESGVVGTPYAQTTTTVFPIPGASASPSGMGSVKKALIAAALLAAAAITPPGKAVLAAIEGKFRPRPAPVERQPVEYHDDEGDEPQEQTARPAPAAAPAAVPKKAAEPAMAVAPTKKAVEPAPKKPAPKPQPAPSQSLPAAPEDAGKADAPAPTAEPEIDLTKFRNLTGRT